MINKLLLLINEKQKTCSTVIERGEIIAIQNGKFIMKMTQNNAHLNLDIALYQLTFYEIIQITYHKYKFQIQEDPENIHKSNFHLYRRE